jgi:Fic family protein
MYIHRLHDWPRFEWNPERLAQPLADIRHRQGRLTGHMEALGFNLRQEAVLSTPTADVLKSSEIEGERLDAALVRSSIARRLGVDIGALKPPDRAVEGVVEMISTPRATMTVRSLPKDCLSGTHPCFPPGAAA